MLGPRACGRAGRAGRAGRLGRSGTAIFGAIAVVGAVALLAPPDLPLGRGLAFTAIREVPPAGWHAGLVLLLALVGAGQHDGPGAAASLAAAGARGGVQRGGGADERGADGGRRTTRSSASCSTCAARRTPAWWGLPLLVLGGASAVLGALRANLEDDVRGVLAASTVASSGFVAMALGAALAARGMDLPAPAAVALGSALLLHLGARGLQGIAAALPRGRWGVRRGRIGWRGWAAWSAPCPGTTLCALTGAASRFALPLSAGFAGEWLLLQALRGGGPDRGSWAADRVRAPDRGGRARGGAPGRGSRCGSWGSRS